MPQPWHTLRNKTNIRATGTNKTGTVTEIEEEIETKTNIGTDLKKGRDIAKFKGRNEIRMTLTDENTKETDAIVNAKRKSTRIDKETNKTLPGVLDPEKIVTENIVYFIH